ncbi:DUF481 domain-containing protein [Marinobacteraceae bacterium S3BR75-40.1]
MRRLCYLSVLLPALVWGDPPPISEDWGLGGPMLSVWEGDVELGLLISSGNTNETTFVGEVDLTQELAAWRHRILLESRYTENAKRTTAENYSAASQVDYKLTDTDYVYARWHYQDDRFSGFDYQASVIGGYGWRFWQQGERFLDLSAGLGYRVRQLKEPDPDNDIDEEEPIARLAASLEYPISENASFEQETSTELTLDNYETVTESESSLKANLNDSLALKVSYSIEHDSNVPKDTKNTDTLTSLTVLYQF